MEIKIGDIIKNRYIIKTISSPQYINELVVGRLITDGFIRKKEDIKDYDLMQLDGETRNYSGKIIVKR